MKESNNAKKISFFIGTMRRGGAERVISKLANFYSNKGWNVDIILLLSNEVNYVLNSNIRIIPMCSKDKSRMKQVPIWVKNIRNYIKSSNPEFIVSFVARINIIVLFACIGLKKKIIISERNDPSADGRSFLVKLATYILYPLSDTIVFQTEYAKLMFPRSIQNKGKIIYNPIEVNINRCESKQKKIVAVGRLESQKNHEMLINSFIQVHNRYPEYSLYIYGEGILMNSLKNQINRLNLEEAIFLPGNISDVHNKIFDSEIFVLSSNYEGLSNALLEAMMMGLPCISTECAGSTEIIRNEENGILVPIGDKQKLSEAMIKLIENKKLAEEIGKKAKETSKLFESNLVLKQWENVIEGIN